MRGAVIPRQAGAVQDDRDGRLVKRDIHQELVERSVHEGCVDADDRVSSAVT